MSKTPVNWIVATGQMWKLYVALAGFVAGLACFILAAFTFGRDQPFTGGMVVTGVVLTVASFLWLASTLRCANCLAKLVWIMVKTRPHTSWLIDLVGLDQCPSCHRPLDRPAR